jgi:putative CocE/NonD family hydrolase
MRDGGKLPFILRWPSKEGRFPVLVTYDGHWGGGTIPGPEEKEYLRQGYAVLGVSSRGTGAAEGVFAPFSTQEGDDGKTIIQWAGQQPWCDGNVGMYGNFYAGATQLGEALDYLAEQKLDVLAVHEALDELAALQERQSQIVELRFFGGYTIAEISEILQVSVRGHASRYEHNKTVLGRPVTKPIRA